MKLYTLDNHFIKETIERPDNFTGIVDYKFGIKQWFLDGKFHRAGGPAVEWSDGDKEWWINGKVVTELEHDLFHSIMKLKGLL